MAEPKWLMGTHAWLRHEEKIAKHQAELKAQGLACCDMGFGPALMAYGQETLREVFLPIVIDMAEGMTVANFDGQRIYIYRRKNAADIMSREEAIAWFGEATVTRIDALIGG